MHAVQNHISPPDRFERAWSGFRFSCAFFGAFSLVVTDYGEPWWSGWFVIPFGVLWAIAHWHVQEYRHTRHRQDVFRALLWRGTMVESDVESRTKI